MCTVIFDMDGLMFDTEAVFTQAWDYAGEKIGIGKAGYMNLKVLGKSITEARDVWEKEFGSLYDEDQLRYYAKAFLTDYYQRNHVPIKKGLHELLEFLMSKGCKLGVATSSPAWEAEHHLKDAGIEGCFHAVVTGDMVKRSKPFPEIYLTICERLEREPSSCFALEDSRNGMLAATRAGCKAIMVPDLLPPDDEIYACAVAVLNDLLEVKRYFEAFA